MSLSSHALVDAIPPIGGKRGRPLSKPLIVQSDRGYEHDKYRRPLHAAGIATEIARRGQPHSSGLGKTRWVLERTISWLHNFRRVRIRFERLTFIHEALSKLVCCIICWRRLQKLILLTPLMQVNPTLLAASGFNCAHPF